MDLDPYRDTGKTCLGGGMDCPNASSLKHFWHVLSCIISVVCGKLEGPERSRTSAEPQRNSCIQKKLLALQSCSEISLVCCYCLSVTRTTETVLNWFSQKKNGKASPYNRKHLIILRGGLPTIGEWWLDIKWSVMHQTKWFRRRMILGMWANAQRDGRPAEYRWRPLFNATKFGWCPLLDAVQ